LQIARSPILSPPRGGWPTSKTRPRPCRTAGFFIELINAQFLKAGGTPDQFRAALDRAIAKGWLDRHESGTYVKFTPAGADLSHDLPSGSLAALVIE